MTVTIYELKGSTIKRALTRLSRKVTVELGSGRTVEIEKGKNVGCTSYEGRPLSKSDESDCLLAEQIVGAC